VTVEAWLQSAIADAESRGLPGLKSALETLARSTAALRAADFNDRATGDAPPAAGNRSSADGPRS
jgi:hypothetical protein